MYSYQFATRYYEADPMGVVHHSEYVRYFELARNRWLEHVGYGFDKCNRDSVVFPVVRLECRYRRSLRFGGIATATVQIKEFSGAKLTVYQTVLDGQGNLCAEGSVVIGFLDARTGRVRRCPDELAQLIENELNN